MSPDAHATGVDVDQSEKGDDEFRKETTEADVRQTKPQLLENPRLRLPTTPRTQIAPNVRALDAVTGNDNVTADVGAADNVNWNSTVTLSPCLCHRPERADVVTFATVGVYAVHG